MSGFRESQKVETRSRAILLPFLEEHSNGRFVVTDKGPLARAFQLQCGDVLFNDHAGRIRAVELKAEEEEKWGNFFLETWSNRNLDRMCDHCERGSNQGWLYHTRADTLFYHFLDTGRLYIIDLFKLKRWAFGYGTGAGRIYSFPEKPQSKYSQLNDTHGRCVPISVVRSEVGFKVFYPQQAEMWPEVAA